MAKGMTVFLNASAPIGRAEGDKDTLMLQWLLRQPGQVLSSDAILAHVWGADRVGEPYLVKHCIHRLRRYRSEKIRLWTQTS